MRSLIPLVSSVITPAVQPALTVDYARRHIRALTPADDILIEGWIRAAAQAFTEYTGRPTITETREIWLDTFPDATTDTWPRKIELPNPPLQSVMSILYTASDGSTASFSDGGSPDTPLYTVNAPQGPYAARGWVEPLFGQVWPTPQTTGASVRIQYVCGYGDTPDEIPEVVRVALAYLVGHYNRFRLPVADQANGSLFEVPLGFRMSFDAFKYSAYPTQLPRSSALGVV